MDYNLFAFGAGQQKGLDIRGIRWKIKAEVAIILQHTRQGLAVARMPLECMTIWEEWTIRVHRGICR